MQFLYWLGCNLTRYALFPHNALHEFVERLHLLPSSFLLSKYQTILLLRGFHCLQEEHLEHFSLEKEKGGRVDNLGI